MFSSTIKFLQRILGLRNPEPKGKRKAEEWYGRYWRLRIDQLERDEFAQKVTSALAERFGSDLNLSVLITAHRDLEVRVLAAIKAGLELDSDCESALIAAIMDESESLYNSAAKSLCSLGTVRGLSSIVVISKVSRGLRAAAARMLQDFGPDARDAIPALMALGVGTAQSFALAAIGEAAVPYLQVAIRTGKHEVECALALREIGLATEDDKRIIHAILEATGLLDSDDG
ncbi:MAG: hypothetical protein U0930_08480 [Pirellulales bacterium]